jgi:hypothetical protein
VRIEQVRGDKPFLFNEPAEDKSGDEPDQAEVIFPILFGRIVGKLHVIQRPEKPVGKFLIELFGNCLDVKGAVELVSDGGDVGLAGRAQFIETERHLRQPFDGGAGRGADLVGEGAELDLAIASSACPGEGELAPVLRDVTNQMLSSSERALFARRGGQ